MLNPLKTWISSYDRKPVSEEKVHEEHAEDQEEVFAEGDDGGEALLAGQQGVDLTLADQEHPKGVLWWFIDQVESRLAHRQHSLLTLIREQPAGCFYVEGDHLVLVYLVC